ncbi:hypothetical protein CANARDRAFT_180809, partial [[Candida] arabinofermentans NRRL YB-2248]
VFGGCCSNVISMESISLIQLNSSNLMTASQYIFISLVGYILLIHKNRSIVNFKSSSKIPIERYMISTFIFFISSFLNNYVIQLNVSIPIHIILRSLSTPITMILGWGYWNKVYKLHQIIGALLLSIGIASFTLSTVTTTNTTTNTTTTTNTYSIIGCLILVISTILSSIIGLFNESSFKRYGFVDWRDNLFYSNFYTLPFLTIFVKPIITEYNMVKENQTFWYLLMINNLTQFICILGVNQLSLLTNSLSVNIALLIRKFLSLVISIKLFGNELNRQGSLSVVIVFMGAVIYTF